MNRSSLVLIALLVAAPASAQHDMHDMTHAESAAPPLSALGNVHHAVSTRVPAAQTAFDQGLALCYGFNHDEAVRAFQKAAALDPSLAMAHWGIAYASGPNINLPMDEDHAKLAWDELQKAQSLATAASEADRAWIQALATRYAGDPKADRPGLDQAYADAMRVLHQRYPDDPDAGTLYAESILDLHPWHWWTIDGKPAPGTEQAIAALDHVLKLRPQHIGANHFYIHALEESPHPERALPAAQRLEAMHSLQAGHLVHMPSHIYERLGEHERSTRINDKAAEIDRAYITKYNVQGVYPIMYYSHNMQFSAFSSMTGGNYAAAMRSAGQLAEHTRPLVKDMAMIEGMVPMTLWVQTQFRRWDEIMSTPDPGEGFPITRLAWHFARGMALAARQDLTHADAELAAYREAVAAVKPEFWFGFNRPDILFQVGTKQLDAAITEARGDRAGAIERWRDAVAAEDSLQYDEPPEWLLYGRPSLGGVLLRDKQYTAAEHVFRDELQRHPGNGRALFGLAEALQAEGRKAEAAKARTDFKRAWKGSDSELQVAAL